MFEFGMNINPYLSLPQSLPNPFFPRIGMDFFSSSSLFTMNPFANYSLMPPPSLNLMDYNIDTSFMYNRMLTPPSFDSLFTSMPAAVTKPQTTAALPSPEKLNQKYAKAFSTKTDYESITKFYNAQKGQNLSQRALSDANSNSLGRCAAYVKDAIANCNMGSYEQGHGYQVAGILKNNKNFKEINVAPNDLNKLPAGCVIVYNKGADGYSSQYGHVEITLGNGNAASDFVNHNIRPSEDVTVFIPV